MGSAVAHELELNLRVRVVTAVYFCATKLEAFAGRGKRDYQSSHDLEDLMAVVDGRPELPEEIHSGPEDVRAYIAAEFKNLLATPEFLDALPGYRLPRPSEPGSRLDIACAIEKDSGSLIDSSSRFGHTVSTLISESSGSRALDG